MKRKYLFVFILALYVIVGVLVMVFYVYPRQKALKDTQWYEAEINNIAIDYVESIDTTGNEPLIRKYSYTDYDKAIETENTNREKKEYPFSKVEVWVRIDKMEYHLYLVKAPDGTLYVEKYEVEDLIYHR